MIKEGPVGELGSIFLSSRHHHYNQTPNVQIIYGIVIIAMLLLYGRGSKVAA